MRKLFQDVAVITLISMLLLIIGLAFNFFTSESYIVIFFYIFFPLIVHLTTRRLVARGESFNYKGSSDFIWIFISPDYFWARQMKPYGERERGEYIFLINKLNLLVSSLLFWLCFCFPLEIISFLLFARIISRSFEIIISFGKDVATKEGANRKSGLDRFDRIQLAIFSLLEIVVLNAGIYYYFCNFYNHRFNPIAMLNSIITSFGVSLLFAVELDKNFFEGCNLLCNSTKSLQALTSSVLIVFAIASYLSNDSGK